MSTKSQPWMRGHGLDRLLARESNVSDLIQLITDRDPSPWSDLVGFIPTDVEREALRSENNADLRLTAEGRSAVVEVKLGHSMSQKQQNAYEAISTSPKLYLAALSADEARVRPDSDRWSFLSLSDLIGAWEQSGDELARHLAAAAAATLRSWDAKIAGVFSDRSTDVWEPMSVLTQKFLARSVARRIASDLRARGLIARASVTSGGGLAIVQAWAPIRKENDDRSFIAEVRWWESKPGGELRFGVDFEPRPGRDEDEEIRRAAYELARSMDAAIHYDALKSHFEEEQPELARFLRRERRSRPSAKGDWEQVIVHGFAGARLPDGSKNNRTKTKPDFYGDGALRHEAIADIDFGQASGLDLTDLIDATLRYLREQQPM